MRGSRQARKNVAVVIARHVRRGGRFHIKGAVANLVNQVGDAEQAPGRHRARGTGEKVRPVEARRDQH